MIKKITLAHGNGGKLTHELISSLILPMFSGGESISFSDSARCMLPPGEIVFTTDSHVVSPIFFPGGNIGTLAVTGTINDLAVMGAKPLFLSCGLIIEDGFDYDELTTIVRSMADTARDAQVRIVTGDTKVVEKGAADRLFINTSGIGLLQPNAPAGVESIHPGDVIIVSGHVGDHGIAIYTRRSGINIDTSLKSDCAAITPLVELAMDASTSIRIMRDPTRGGLATTLNEFVLGQSFGIEINEQAVPVREEVRAVCEILGFDPLYIANEGKLVLVVPEAQATAVLSAIKTHPLGCHAAIIGQVSARACGRVLLTTVMGGNRILDVLVHDMLPRIC